MPVVRRPRLKPTDDWEQLQLLAPCPEQRAYELLRPVVLFPLDDAQWLKAFRLAPYTPRRRHGGDATQLPLWSVEQLATLSV